MYHVLIIAAREGGEASDLCGDKNLGLQIELRQLGLTIVDNNLGFLPGVRRGCEEKLSPHSSKQTI